MTYRGQAFVAATCAIALACSKKSAPPAGTPLHPGDTPNASSSASAATTTWTERPTVETLTHCDPPGPPDSEAEQGAACTFETWFRQGSTKQLLATNGAAVGASDLEDPPASAKLSGNTIHYEFDGTSCPSNWVGDYEADFTASPLALVSERANSWHRDAECSATREEWSWYDFRGKVVQDCPRGDRCEARESLPIPDVSVPDAYVGDAWPNVACLPIDACSAGVDGTEGHGYVTFGTRARNDPTFHAVLAGLWLFVQVDGLSDQGGAAGDDASFSSLPDAAVDDRHWVRQNHLEVWTGSSLLSSLDCTVDEPPKQWGVRLSDARVFLGAGHPTAALTAERVPCGGRSVSLRMLLPAKPDALTVAYSAGSRNAQRMLLATSRWVYGDGTTLGTVKHIHPSRARCEVRAGALEPVMAAVAGDKALASFD